MEQYIKDFSGKIYGILETDGTGKITARNIPSRMIVGYYYPNRDVTTDFYGRIVSRGNTVVSLIEKP